MARRKQFSITHTTTEPLIFTIGDQEFTCIPNLPASTFVKLSRETKGGEAIEQTMDFFYDVLIDEDVPRFKALMSSKETQPPFDLIIDIMKWLIEEYTENPTQRPSSTEAGQPTTGNGSMANSSSTISTQ